MAALTVLMELTGVLLEIQLLIEHLCLPKFSIWFWRNGQTGHVWDGNSFLKKKKKHWELVNEVCEKRVHYMFLLE